MNKTRLEAFSDGVLAIIITIMVLEFKIPKEADWEALSHLIPIFLSYVLSFIYVGIYWNNHHHLMHPVKNISASIMWSNHFLLFCLSLIPFATGWMGEHLYQPLPVVAYAILLLLCGLSYDVLRRSIIWCHPHDHKLVTTLNHQNRKSMISILSYTTAIGMAFIYPAISMLIFGLVAIMWVIPSREIEQAFGTSD